MHLVQKQQNWTKRGPTWRAQKRPNYSAKTTKLNKTEQKANKANKTSFLRGYNTYTRKQEKVSFVRFLEVIGKFCCGFVGQQNRNKTATKFLEF